MKLYDEFTEALQEVAESAKEENGFSERFSKMVKNYMNGMIDRSNLEDVISETIRLEEKADKLAD